MQNSILLNKLINFVKSLSNEDFSSLVKIYNTYKQSDYYEPDFLPDDFIKKMQVANATKRYDVETTNNLANETIEKFVLVSKFYSDEIRKINLIIQNNEILKKINGAKIICYGETGTGKATLINKIISDNPSIKYAKEVNLTELVSYKMGQTQLNLLKLSRELAKTQEKTIIFIDELDSIINKRLNSDLGEHSRIVATFLKFIDELPENVILFAATNHLSLIDEAVVRRSNIQLETHPLYIDEFLELLPLIGFKLEKGKKATMKSIFKNRSFTFADFVAIQTELIIIDYIEKERKPEFWIIFIKKFIGANILENLEHVEWSLRDKIMLKKHKIIDLNNF
ncbi:ATPase, AAA family [Spiroplasma clarkii]|uniref:ATPase, AAA family n=1 Tax=Spiroplasma clarkii TaxID=2139 RepID=A0A1Y0L1Q1_9MOLU|nr:ATP-binding protein [Spiroplasma clarkii]ARU91903.1 ATPase, AAA family [Spiroplasma clarkii]ATX71249.1 ATPase, AAA family [Spiroplasma clarkii]